MKQTRGTMKRITLLLGLLSGIFTAQSAQALEFGFDLASEGLRSYTASANPWTANRTFGGVNLRGEVGFNPNWRVGFSWHYAGTDGNLHGLATTTGRYDLTLDGRYRYPVQPWLVPYARAGLGVSRTKLTLPTWEGTNWTPQIQTGLGLELLLPASLWSKKEDPLPSFGVFMEFGWQMVFDQDATLTATDTTQAGVQPSDLHLGTLSLNGLLMRFGAAVRF
jgi:opacity protein-like surface antigen